MNEPEKKSTIAHVILWGLFGVIVLLIVLMASIKKKPEKVDEIELKPTAVRTVTMEPASIPDVILIPGRIEPWIEAHLASEKDAQVVRISANKGDHVEAGQILLELDKRIWKHILNKAKLDIRESEKDLKRWEGLRESGAVSVAEFDRIKTKKEMAEIALADAEVNISQCEIVSPIDGILDDRRIEVGEYARAGEPLFTVVDMDNIKLTVDVPEQDISKLKTGQDVTFTVAALSGMTFTGQISFISILASRESNSFRTEIEVANPDHTLKPGMIAESRIVRAIRDDALVVPLASIIPQKGDHIVFIAQDNHAVRRLVHIGSIVGSDAIISTGITPGEALIVEGHRALVDGTPITIQNSREDSP